MLHDSLPHVWRGYVMFHDGCLSRLAVTSANLNSVEKSRTHATNLSFRTKRLAYRLIIFLTQIKPIKPNTPWITASLLV